jgi:membrane fusion protein (multidrug efflux system)
MVAAIPLVLMGSGCGGGEGEATAAASPGPARTIPVAIEEIGIGAASSYYVSTASLEAKNYAQILARTTGTIRRLVHEEGDDVSAGDTLLLIEDDEARLRVQQAEANLETARAEHDRRRAMLENELLSPEEFGTTENTLRIRESDHELAKLELSYTRVQSPFDGRVVRRLVDLGANVSPGTPLFEIMDVNPLLARVYIPAKRMGFVAPGQKMEITLDSSGTVLTGDVSLVSPIVDPTTGTVKVTAEIFEYPEGTRPGDFAHVRIVTARHENTKLVPSRAIFEEQGQNILYVTDGTKAERRVVETGFVDGDYTEVLDGVETGELVVVKGQRQLREGIGVEVLEGPPEILAALEAAGKRTREEAEDETSADAS